MSGHVSFFPLMIFFFLGMLGRAYVEESHLQSERIEVWGIFYTQGWQDIVIGHRSGAV